jgi:AI-2 transport protein TqsA
MLFLLVQAKFLLISLAIAIILFSLTSDAIGYIQRLRFGEARFSVGWPAVLAVLLIASILLSMSALILTQANTVVFTIMQYAEPMQRAVAELFRWMGEDVEQAVLNWLKGIRIGTYAATLAGQAGNIASGAVLVILFVGFLFLERLWFTQADQSCGRCRPRGAG